MATIESTKGISSDQSIPILAEIVDNLKTLKYRDCPERDEILKVATNSLVSIPGYADFYADRIRAARDRVEAEQDYYQKHDLIYNVLKPACGGFRSLAHLPSPDSVRVLGEFLYDERGRFIQDPANRITGEKLWGILETRTSNCEHAVRALAYMPIVGKPTPPDKSGITDGSYEVFTEVPAWREWYERVKSGRTTFRFEGDPVEYDLNGPASPEKLARIKANRERDTDRERRRNVSASDGEAPAAVTGDTPLENAPAISRRLPLLLGVAFLLAAMAWYFLRRIKRPRK